MEQLPMQADDYLERIIQWSETEFLDQQYLHLHEQDIGYVGDYRLWKYLVGFLRSIEPLCKDIAKVIFCYSWEKIAPLDPGDCERELYFAVTLQSSAQVSDRLTLCVGDFQGDGGGDVLTRPEPRSLHSLVACLSECDIVQPYILRKVDGGVDCNNRTIEGSENTVRELIEWFRAEGGYQFSIYGFVLRDGVSFSDEDKTLLRHALVHHIITWNHDLNGAHGVRHSIHESLVTQEVSFRVETGKEAVSELLNTIERLGGSQQSPYAHAVIPIQYRKHRIFDSLFKGSEFHELADITLESFPNWTKVLHQWALRGNSELRVFADCCGVSDWEQICRGLSDAESVVWARSCWLATKLLTRRLLVKEDFRGIWQDQISLAILFGLARNDRSGISVEVQTVSTESPTGENTQSREDFLNASWICDADNPSDCWPHGGWNINYDEGYTAEWEYPKDEPLRKILQCFLRMGLLRVEEQIPAERQLCIREKRESSSIVASKCLGNLMLLTRYLADSRRGQEDGHIALRAVEIEFDVDPWSDDGSSNSLKVHLRCDGELNRAGHVIEGTPAGSFLGPLFRIAECFGQREPGKGRPGNRAGVFICDGDDNYGSGQSTDIVISFNSWQETWWKS
jgi:hypothetical protein